VLDSRGERNGDTEYISRAQLEWLLTGLRESESRFKLIMSSVPMTDYADMLGEALADDRWQGFPEQRGEILSFIEEQILFSMNLSRNLSLVKTVERQRLVQDEHLAVLEAIRRKDGPAAARAMRAHLENALERMFGS